MVELSPMLWAPYEHAYVSHASYEVRLLRIAEDDLTEIMLYVAADRPTAAVNLADRIEKRLILLADNPHLGSVPIDESLALLGYRYLVIDNYLVFYVIEYRVVKVPFFRTPTLFHLRFV